MKRAHFFLLGLCLLVVGITLSLRPLIVFVAKKELSKAFVGSTVAIQGCSLGFTQLSLSGIEIKKPRSHDFKINRVVVEYNLVSLFHGRIPRIILEEGQIDIDLAKQEALKLQTALMPKGSSAKAPFFIENAVLDHFKIKLRTKDLKADIVASVEIALTNQVIRSLELQVNSVEFQGVILKNGTLKVVEQGPGNFHMESFQYDKLKVTDIASRVTLDQEKLIFPDLVGTTLNGKVGGELTLSNNPLVEYKFNIRVNNLDVQVFIREFEFDKTFSMTGLMSGNVNLAGKGAGVKILSGNISLGEKGGVLVINDTRFLETVAKNSNLPTELVVDSFKNYNYNTGVIALSLDQGDVGVEISLDGKAGKQKFNFIFHDLF